MSAAWIGAGWLRRTSDKLLGRLILILLVALGCVQIAEGLLIAEPMRLVGADMVPTVLVAAACGVVIGLVSSLLGVAGGELIIPVFVLLFGVDVKLAGSMSMLVAMPTIAVGLLRHCGAGSVLPERAVWRATIFPLGAGSVLGAILGALALGLLSWLVAIDARLAKWGAPLALRGQVALSIGCGPGHVAGLTCDVAVETRWGDDLGAVILCGPTATLADEPRAIDGIGDPVAGGDIVARIGAYPVAAPICGTLRGMLRGGIAGEVKDKLCEVDPRPEGLAVFTGIGQRPAAIAEGVARAIDRAQSRISDAIPPVAAISEPPTSLTPEKEPRP